MVLWCMLQMLDPGRRRVVKLLINTPVEGHLSKGANWQVLMLPSGCCRNVNVRVDTVCFKKGTELMQLHRINACESVSAWLCTHSIQYMQVCMTFIYLRVSIYILYLFALRIEASSAVAIVENYMWLKGGKVKFRGGMTDALFCWVISEITVVFSVVVVKVKALKRSH